jgi:phosphate starvation-inducible PhoH-like protein
LSEVCGANDRNLLLIEKLLGARVISKGNELFLEKEDPQKYELLRLIIRELETHTRNGQTPTPELISSIFHGLDSDGADGIELLKSISINVPGGFSRVFPRAIRQAVYIQAIQNRDMVFGIGPAGTGKTYLAVACALEEVLTRRKRKLILTRPVVEAGESLGFLPGDSEAESLPAAAL